MPTSKASAEWNGSIKAGKGSMKPANGPDVPFSMGTRFAGEKGSNPEELIGAALSGCYSMALSLGLEMGGVTPVSIKTTADVHLEKQGEGFHIPKIDLATTITAKGDEAKIKSIAEETKKQCPVSKVLSAAQITLHVTVQQA